MKKRNTKAVDLADINVQKFFEQEIYDETLPRALYLSRDTFPYKEDKDFRFGIVVDIDESCGEVTATISIAPTYESLWEDCQKEVRDFFSDPDRESFDFYDVYLTGYAVKLYEGRVDCPVDNFRQYTKRVRLLAPTLAFDLLESLLDKVDDDNLSGETYRAELERWLK